MQGAYLQKGFQKHGPLSNPFSFGYFPPMKHNAVQRFTHTFTVYDGDQLPERYRGKLFGVAPLLHHVVVSEVISTGSTFETRDIGYAVSTDDKRFIPVDIKHGPDGALYVADWRDEQCAHTKAQEGQVDKSNGGVYRIKSKSAPMSERAADLSRFSTSELVDQLSHSDRWRRRTAQRLLRTRADQTVVPKLIEQFYTARGQLALETLWAIDGCGGFSEPVAIAALAHSEPQVRAWGARLICDQSVVSASLVSRLADLAQSELDVETRSQLASSAKRLPPRDCLTILSRLIPSERDIEDPRMPLLLWWGIESVVAREPSLAVDLFRDASFWRLPTVEQHLAERIMRRFAATGRRQDLVTCAELLSLAPNEADFKRLMTGFEAAYVGRAMTNLPRELEEAMETYSSTSVLVGIRRGNKDAIGEAIRLLSDDTVDSAKRVSLIQTFGEVSHPACVPTLTRIATQSSDAMLQGVALSALARYGDPMIADSVISVMPQMTDEARSAAIALLASRPEWTVKLLDEVEVGNVDKNAIPLEIVQRLSFFRDPRIVERLRKHFGSTESEQLDRLKAEVERVSGILRAGHGVPKAGRPLFEKQCSKCHALFGKGGAVGPDLTSFKRDDLEKMLLSIVHPNAEIREGFASYLAITQEGRSIVGILLDKNPQTILLRTPEGVEVAIPTDEIEEFTPTKISLMPEGLLKDYNDQELCDLFGYLRMTQPLID